MYWFILSNRVKHTYIYIQAHGHMHTHVHMNSEVQRHTPPLLN